MMNRTADRIKERGLDKDLVVSYNLRRTVGMRTSIKQWYKTMKLLAKQDYIISRAFYDSINEANPDDIGWVLLDDLPF